MLETTTRWSVCLLFFCHLTSANPRWPAGAYGLPKPQAGCPEGTGLEWSDGWVLQDTVSETNHAKSSSFHLKADLNKNIKRYFCIKTSDGSGVARGAWPRGQYCIYRRGGTCPAGLSSGSVYWDDEDWWNVNKHGGVLPDGTYNSNTRIQFCCRTETGFRETPILLPTTRPFFLLAYGSASCQRVKWALDSLEWLTYDTHDGSTTSGKYPYGASSKNPQIHYCYYTSCNYTHTANAGSFQSPNHPKYYPNGQWCSWRITVASGFVITLQFTSFNLESLRNTDQVLVHDGQNETSLQIGAFYGDNEPPNKGIQSSSNNMFVVFKSDELHNSFTGFKANYFAVAPPPLLHTTVVTSSSALPAVSEPSSVITPTLAVATYLQRVSSSERTEAITMTPTQRSQPSSTIDGSGIETQKFTAEPTVLTPTSSDKASEDSLESDRGKLASDDDDRTPISVGLSLLFVTIIVAVVTLVIWRMRKRTRQKKKTDQTTNPIVVYNSEREMPHDTADSNAYESVTTITNPTYSRIEECTAAKDTNPYATCNLEYKEKSSENPLYDSGRLVKVQDNPTYESSSKHYETIPIV